METLGSVLVGIITWTLMGYVLYRLFKPSPWRNRSAWMRLQRSGRTVPIGPLPYQKKRYLLSAAERDFYETLRQAVGERYLIFAKVRLLDLLWLPQNLSDRQTYMNRVQAKHVDFVLCHPQTVAPALVIELDDASHQAPERQERDTFLNEVLRVAGIPLQEVLFVFSPARADPGGIGSTQPAGIWRSGRLRPTSHLPRSVQGPGFGS